MKIKKLLSGILAATVALTSLSVSAITSSAADINGTLTITANNGALASYQDSSDVQINGAGKYTATVSFHRSSTRFSEIGFFTFSPYPSEGDFPFYINVDSVTIQNTDGYDQTFTNILHSTGLVPASTYSQVATDEDKAALPRKKQYETGTIVSGDDANRLIYNSNGYVALEKVEDGTGLAQVINTITYNFTVVEGLPPADFTKLKEAVEKAKTYKDKEKLYKPETYNLLTNALAEGEKLLENDKATQKDIDAAVEAINSAINGLVEKAVSLKETINTTKNTYMKGDSIYKYTIPTYSTLTEAVSSGEAIAENSESTQEAIDAAEQAIKDAISGLKERADSDHAQKLHEASNRYRNVTGTGYTKESFAKFRELVDKLLEMTQENSSNEDIDQMISEVQAAYEALEYAPLDFTLIVKALARGWEITENPDYATYVTEKSYAELTEAVKKAEELFEKGIKESGDNFNHDTATVTQTDLEMAAYQLIYCVEHLEYNPADYTKVDEAIAKIPADLSVYTDETVKALNDAKNAVDRTKNIMEQDTVDGYAQAIEDAIAALEYKPADYTKVDEAIAKIPADLSIYTEESVAALNAAVDAVDRTKNITEQETVDGYAQAIEDAIAALVEVSKGNDVSGTVTTPGIDAEVTVTVATADGETVSEAKAANGEYTIPELEDGEYVITFAAEGYVTRSYAATVTNGEIDIEAELHAAGDINGDGIITTVDVGLANAHAKGSKTLEDYDFEVAEVSGDEKITTVDVGMINATAKGVK